MIFMTDDPIADFDRYDREQQALEDKLPHCDICGEAIDDHVYEIDGVIYCMSCIEAKYKRDVEDYLR